MKGLILYLNQHKWLKAIIIFVIIVALYFGLCLAKMMPKGLNVISRLSRDASVVETEENELISLGDSMYFQNTLVADDFYKINGTLYIPLEKLCKAFGYECTSDDTKTVVKTETEVRALEISHNRFIKGDGEFKVDNEFNELNSKIVRYENATYIAYDDVSTVFDWLSTATLKSGKKCVYDPVPYIPIGISFEQSYDELAAAYAGEGKLLTIEEFRKLKKIPQEISLDTDENIFYNNMSISSYYGDDYQKIADALVLMGVDESILMDGNAQYGAVMDALTLGQVIQKTDVSEYCNEYGLLEDLIGFEVTYETPYKDIRNIKTINEIDALSKQAKKKAIAGATIAPTATPEATPGVSIPPAETVTPTIVPTIAPTQEPLIENAKEHENDTTVGEFVKMYEDKFNLTYEEVLEKLGLDTDTPSTDKMDDYLDKITIEAQASLFGMTGEEFIKRQNWPSSLKPTDTLADVVKAIENAKSN